MLRNPSESQAAAVFDFLDEYLDDLEQGRRHPLSHYLARYPKNEDGVAREFLRLRGEVQAKAGVDPAESDDDDTRIGPYRLIRELGRGGQGTVFLAEDTRIARQVALKVLTSRFETVSEDRLKRFRREAEVVSRLEHPGICAIYDADIDGRTPYIAMRYVEGDALSALIAGMRVEENGAQVTPTPTTELGLSLAPGTPLELRRVLRMFERTARALHAAHEAGIVHRDVKPGNLMVTSTGDPVILDFGLARDETSEVGSLTASGDVFGTPAYMSPEQLLSSGHTLDRRTDVYSLGVALYEALTLHRPFEAPSKAELYHAIQNEPITDPKSLNPHLPEEVKVVLETALEKDRARRYPTALEFAEDLRRIREYEPIHARPASAGLRLRRWVRRHPVMAVTLVLLTSALTLSLYLLGKERVATRFGLGRHLAERSKTLLSEDQGAALALAIEATQLAPNYVTRSTLFDALEACSLKKTLDGDARLITDIVLTPDGTRLLAAQDNGLATLWDIERGERIETLGGHSGTVFDVASSPDGRYLASAGMDGLVLVRDAASLETMREIEHEGAVLGLAFGSPGSLATLSEDGVLRIFRIDEGHEEHARVENLPGAQALSFSARGDWILIGPSGRSPDPSPVWLVKTESGSTLELSPSARSAQLSEGSLLIAEEDGTIRLYELEDPEQERASLKLARRSCYVRMSPEQTRVAICFEDGNSPQVVLWDPHEGGRLPLFGHRGRKVVHADFSPDGQRLATASHDLTVRVWNVVTGRQEASFKSYFQPVQVSWTPGGNYVLTRYNGPVVQVWYARGRPDIIALDGHIAPVRSVEFDADGQRALSASDDGTARLWWIPENETSHSPRPGELLVVFEGHRAAVSHASFSPDGKLVLTLCDDGAARIFDSREGDLLEVLDHPTPLRAGCFSPSGDRVLTVDEAGRARVWISERRVLSLESERAVRCAVFSPDGTRVATAGEGGSIVLWRTQDGTKEHSFQTSEDGTDVRDLAFHPEGLEIAAACDDLTVRFFGLDQRGKRDTIDLFPPRQLAFSHSGDSLIVIGDRGGGAVRVQDLVRNEQRRKPEIFHTGDLTRGILSRDGRRALIASKDGSVSVWETHSGRPFLHRDMRQGIVHAAAFSHDPEGRRAITGGEDGSVLVWPVDPLPDALKRKPRELRHWEKAREQRLARPLTYR